MQFRPAAPADVPAVVALVESAYRGTASRAGWTTEADLLGGQRTDAGEITEAVHDDRGVLLVADTGQQLVGCCRLRRAGEVAEFGTFAVSPQHQAGGIGRRLLAHAEQLAAGWGCGQVEMTVIAQRTELLAWYGRRGYTATGERRRFPYGQERFGRPLRDDLHFLVLTKTLSAS